jgi:hypothetical protein
MSAILKEDPPELPGANRQIPPVLERINRRLDVLYLVEGLR